MATSGALSAAPAPSDRPRPNVLAYPSPTTSRYLIFLAALHEAVHVLLEHMARIRPHTAMRLH